MEHIKQTEQVTCLPAVDPMLVVHMHNSAMQGKCMHIMVLAIYCLCKQTITTQELASCSQLLHFSLWWAVTLGIAIYMTKFLSEAYYIKHLLPHEHK